MRASASAVNFAMLSDLVQSTLHCNVRYLGINSDFHSVRFRRALSWKSDCPRLFASCELIMLRRGASRNMLLKKAARLALHKMGGLAVLRGRHRREFGVLMFHSFSERDAANVEAICAHIARHFEPVSLSTITDAL